MRQKERSAMNYVLGVDSGGTKYLLKAADARGHVLASHIGQPAPHYKIGDEEAYRRIEASFARCLEAFGGRPEDCLAITVGTTGMDAPEDERRIAAIYARLPGFRCPIEVVNDAQVAHYAATGGTGVIVIAGTGSIAYGRDSRGQACRVGGWPPCIGGDEGSGTWIVCQALGHVSRVMDGREAPTPLSDLLAERLRLRSPGALIELCQRLEHGDFQNPGIGQWINELAARGDDACAALLRRAGEENAALARGVIRQLRFDGPFIVGAWGSALVRSRVQMDAFRASLLRDYPAADIRVPQGDAADGAVAMALRRINAPENTKPAAVFSRSGSADRRDGTGSI